MQHQQETTQLPPFAGLTCRAVRPVFNGQLRQSSTPVTSRRADSARRAVDVAIAALASISVQQGPPEASMVVRRFCSGELGDPLRE